MPIWRRAWLYIRRKKGKSMLLLLVMLLLFSLVMVGILLYHTTDAAIRQVRQNIGGGFRIAPDMQNRDNIAVDTVDGQTSMTYIGEPLDWKLIQAILDVQEILEYNVVIRGEALLQENLSLIDYNGRYQEDMTVSRLVSVEADTNPLRSNLFQTGQVRLTDGNTTGISGEIGAIISEALAQKNNLQVGDEIRIFPCDDESGTSVQVKISGFFAVEAGQQNKDNAAPVYLLENRIFLNPNSGMELLGAAGADYVDFFVNDPAQVYEMMEDIGKISHMERGCFTVTARIGEYEKAAGPLLTVRKLAGTLLTIMGVVSMVVLSLIQALFHKSRQHEMGIMLSVGISKKEILLQHFVETALLAATALVLAACISFTVWPYINSRIFNTDTAGVINRLEVASMAAVVSVTVVGGILGLLISVILSNLWVMRLSPRKILSRLS